MTRSQAHALLFFAGLAFVAVLVACQVGGA
jgi:hypothetical protein